MANGHGGRRPGSGRKPKTSLERHLDGNAGHRGKLLAHPSAGNSPTVAPIEEFDAPDTLTRDERIIWLRQAPEAFANRTLTRATALAFERYCGLVVREALERTSSGCDGPNHRGMVRQLNTLELQFGLVPCGKAILRGEPEKSANPVDKFLQRRR